MWGFLISHWGDLLTLLGVGIALWQLGKTRTAAEAAQKASEATRQERLKLDALAELSAAMAMLDEIKGLHRERVWGILPDRYSKFRRHLVSVRETVPDKDSEQQTHLTSAISQLLTMERRVERALAHNNVEGLDPAQLNTIVSKQADGLEMIMISLKRTRSGGNNA